MRVSLLIGKFLTFLSLCAYCVLGEQIYNTFYLNFMWPWWPWPLAVSIFKTYGRGRMAAIIQTASGRVAVVVRRGRGGRDGPQP